MSNRGVADDSLVHLQMIFPKNYRSSDEALIHKCGRLRILTPQCHVNLTLGLGEQSSPDCYSHDALLSVYVQPRPEAEHRV